MDIFTVSYLALWLMVIAEGAALVLALRALGNLYLGTRAAIERDGLSINSKAPVFSALTLQGRTINSRDFPRRWSVLIFVLPTCRICREMLPDLDAFAQQVSPDIGTYVLVRGDPETAEELAGRAPRIEVLAITDRVAARLYRARVSPYVTVVDPDGVVRAKGVVDRIDHVAHLLAEAGLQNEVTRRHERAELDRARQQA